MSEDRRTVFHSNYADRLSLFSNPSLLTTANMEGIVTIVGLKPETTYAVRLAALNGKGLGEISTASEFKTQPVRKYTQRPASSPHPPSSWGAEGTPSCPILCSDAAVCASDDSAQGGLASSPPGPQRRLVPSPFYAAFPKELGGAVPVAGPAC